MATPSPPEPVTPDDVLAIQFTCIRKGGYDTQEVDAFLDRVAATLERNDVALPAGSMTAEDVRGLQLSQVKRGGYNTQEVDSFLDSAVSALELSASSPIGIFDDAPPEYEEVADDLGGPVAAYEIPDPGSADESGIGTASAPEPLGSDMPEAAEVAPVEVAPPDPPAAVAEVAVVEAVLADATPEPDSSVHLHDPGGAAQRLLAAAQQATDILTADAGAYAEQVRGEADQYASATRSEADVHASAVTKAAETQAAAIRTVAADEARKVAEQARSELVADVAHAEARQSELQVSIDELTNARAELVASVSTDRERLLRLLDEIRSGIESGLGTDDVLAVDVEPPPEPAPDIDLVKAEGPPESVPEDPVAEDAVPEESVPEDPVPEDAAAEDPVPEDAAAEDAAAEDPAAEDPAAEDPAAEASRSVFDVVEDPSEAEEKPDEPKGLFDIESDPDWDEEDPPAPAVTAVPDASGGSGESFFDELRQADAETDGLGPVDDDTDAALSAFFEADDDEDPNRWRDRFGPGRD